MYFLVHVGSSVRKPDASDPINAEWVTPLLVSLASSKKIDPAKPHRATRAEHKRELGPLTLEFHDGTAQFAGAIYEVYKEVRPHLVEITGWRALAGHDQIDAHPADRRWWVLFRCSNRDRRMVGELSREAVTR